MEIVCITAEEATELQKKRIAFFSELASKSGSLENFAYDNDEKMAIVGIELKNEGKYVSLYMQLDFSEYEQYHIIETPTGTLTCSNVIRLQEYCANMVKNVLTGEYVDEEDIIKEYGKK